MGASRSGGDSDRSGGASALAPAARRTSGGTADDRVASARRPPPPPPPPPRAPSLGGGGRFRVGSIAREEGGPGRGGGGQGRSPLITKMPALARWCAWTCGRHGAHYAWERGGRSADWLWGLGLGSAILRKKKRGPVKFGRRGDACGGTRVRRPPPGPSSRTPTLCPSLRPSQPRSPHNNPASPTPSPTTSRSARELKTLSQPSLLRARVFVPTTNSPPPPAPTIQASDAPDPLFSSSPRVPALPPLPGAPQGTRLRPRIICIQHLRAGLAPGGPARGRACVRQC
jgi:hypothetical protein